MKQKSGEYKCLTTYSLLQCFIIQIVYFKEKVNKLYAKRHDFY